MKLTSQEQRRAIVGVSRQEPDALRKCILEVGFAMMQGPVQRLPALRVLWSPYRHRIVGCDPQAVEFPQGREMDHLLPFSRNLFLQIE